MAAWERAILLSLVGNFGLSPNISMDRALLQATASFGFGFSFLSKAPAHICGLQMKKAGGYSPSATSPPTHSQPWGSFVVEDPYHTCLKRLIKP
jgi:hypothetical protein